MSTRRLAMLVLKSAAAAGKSNITITIAIKCKNDHENQNGFGTRSTYRVWLSNNIPQYSVGCNCFAIILAQLLCS